MSPSLKYKTPTLAKMNENETRVVYRSNSTVIIMFYVKIVTIIRKKYKINVINEIRWNIPKRLDKNKQT